MVSTLAVLIPLFPLIACLMIAVFGAKLLRERSYGPAILGCALASISSLVLLSAVGQSPEPVTTALYRWIDIPGPDFGPGSLPDALSITIALRADSLSATMLAMLTFVGTLVAIYASGYMHGDRGYWRFFAVVSLFVFSMIMLVLSANFLQMFVFWEGVGLCSYLLVGFWYEKPAAAAAGKKAFVVNRIGDFGFLAGVFLIWDTFGTLDYQEVLDPARISAADPATIHLICLCLFTGAVGKSAQFPLHVWLPDAMEGPTPVSALIHAATMVTAGVYLVARCTPLFSAAPDVQLLISCIGGFTALLAALIALTQTDLKRVLAYSTVSQLGYMFLGLGTGLAMGVGGAMFHLVTHAFFKALLFLGAGSVMHAMGGVIDMRRFSGLKSKMPQTYWTFLIGSLALAGLFPLSGFWSKDTILAAVREAAQHEHAGSEAVHGAIYLVLFWMGTFTALLTAFYTFRAFFMTFHGPERIPEEAGHHAHESPPVMCLPLWILAVGAAFLGLALGHLTNYFGMYLGTTLPGVAEEHHSDWLVIGLSSAAAVVGILVAWAMYGQPSPLPARLARLAGPLTALSQNKFYLDELYLVFVVWPLRGLGTVCSFLDRYFIDRILVDGTGMLPAWFFGKHARPMQNGLVQFYALSMMLAMAVLLVALLWRQA